MRLHPACPVRGWVFEREEGYWTGGVAIDPVATELPARLARSPRPRRVAR